MKWKKFLIFIMFAGLVSLVSARLPLLIDYNMAPSADTLYSHSYNLEPMYITEPGTQTPLLGFGRDPTLFDIDNDGDLDLFAFNERNYAQGWWLHYNDGNSTHPIFNPNPSLKYYLFHTDNGGHFDVVDFDLDGDRDILLTGEGDNAGEFYKNTGSNNEVKLVRDTFPISGNFRDISASDVDLDGDLDLLLDVSDNRIHYWRNDGTSWFQVSTALIGTIGGPIEVLDGDGDNDEDIIIQSLGVLKYYRRNSETSWTYICDLLGTGTIDYFDVGDLDGDGKKDIILSDTGGTLKWYKNTGFNGTSGTCTNWEDQSNIISVPSTRALIYYGYSNPPFVQYTDIDGDDDYDIVIGGYLKNSTNTTITYRVAVWYNQGNRFQPDFKNDENTVDIDFIPNSMLSGRAYPNPAMVDLDNDGDYDAILGFSDGHLSQLKNIGNSTNYSWEITNSDVIGDIGSYTYPALGDLDNDGDYDLLVSNDTGFIYYYENTGSKTNAIFTLRSNNLVGDYGGHTRIWLQDIDGDSDLDIWATKDGALTINYFENLGNLNFTQNTRNIQLNEELHDESFYFNYDERMSVPVDLDGDGYLDWAGDLGSIQSGSYKYFSKRYYLSSIGNKKFVDFNYANSDFVPNVTTNEQYTSKLADLDGDGDYDIITTNYNNASVNLYRNAGNKNSPDFSSATSEILIDIGTNIWLKATTVDIDDDNDFDIFLARDDNDDIDFYENTGSSTNPIYTYHSNILNLSTSGIENESITFYDWDNDGDLDLFTGTRKYYRNDGNKTDFNFVGEAGYNRIPTNSTWEYDDCFGDVDYDGDKDWITSIKSYSATYLYDAFFLENISKTPNKPFFEPHSHKTWTDNGNTDVEFSSCSFADLDNDGDEDLIQGQSGHIYYFTNQVAHNLNVYFRDENNFVSDINMTVIDENGLIVCTGTSDSNGHITCDIEYGQSYDLNIPNNLAPYIGIHTSFDTNEHDGPKSRSVFRMIAPQKNLLIDLNTVKYSIANAKDEWVQFKNVGIADTIGTGKATTDAQGKAQILVPERYLINMKETGTQNKIVYTTGITPKLSQFIGEDYRQSIILPETYSPNEIKIGDNNFDARATKSVSSKIMNTDSNYYVYLFYPVMNAMQDFNITDTIATNPTDFNFASNVTVYYSIEGDINSCEYVIPGTPTATQFTIDYTTSGCEFLGNEGKYNMDWVMLEYKIASPISSLSYFLTNTKRDYILPSATFRLKA